MSSVEQEDRRLDYLLRRLCDDRLDDGEAAELAELLAASESAQRRYIEHVQLCTELADWSSATVPMSIPYRVLANGANKKVCDQQPMSATLREGTGDGQLPQGRTQAHSVRPWSWLQPRLNWGIAAATIMVALVLGWSFLNKSNPKHFKTSDSAGGLAATSNSNSSDAQDRAREGKFVARIVEVTSDAQWDEKLHPREFLMRLREGDRIHLVSGLAHLEFYSGARIILQGPSEFTPTGPAGGRLESGRLTGKVEGGNFQLTTPTAKVVDLGTEFGVTVGPSSDTDVCVFLGEVEVQAGSEGRGKHRKLSEAYNLTQGMSVRVAATGKVSDGMDAGVDYDSYTRSFPSPANSNPGELDLVDIVCGGNGQGMRLAAAIDPLTGQWDRRPWINPLSPGTRKGDGRFHPADWHPFIDGTFVPTKRGEPMQVDTQRGTITLPNNTGDYTWGPIWARRAVKAPNQFDRSADSWGAKTYPVITERLTQCRLGGIGIHASVGITFDLKAIGKEHPGRIDQLKGLLCNLENSKEHNPDWARQNPAPSADFRVFVDGKMRYERLDFHRNVEGVPFSVDLSPEDRFLTFVTTDAGNTNRYDHIVVIDPVLEIQAIKRTHVARPAALVRVGHVN